MLQSKFIYIYIYIYICIHIYISIYIHKYIVVTGTITVQTENNRAIDVYNRNLILKNNATFINCI